MTSQIKTIEDLSLNAWPSYQIQVYDGWLLRFSHFYTHRTNSVEELGPSTIPLEEKLSYCEQIYDYWNSPSVFKITPLSNPDLDHTLEKRGYHIEHITDVMTINLSDASLPNPIIIEETHNLSINAENVISPKWIHALFDLKGTENPIHKKIVPSMYAAIPKDVISLSISQDEQIIATGLGILDRDYIGIYAIHVSERYRQKGLGKTVVETLLFHGKQNGAAHAYLQVVADNTAAKHLYRKIGFQYLYTYWFRVRR